MAKGDKDEHRMLFDIRGRRRNVVKVVYGVLALLMGLSLLLVAGPLPFGDIFGTQDAVEQANEQLEDQAERIEVKVKKDPDNPELLLALMKARVRVGNAQIDEPAPGQVAVTVESLQEYEQASSLWTEYLEATDEPATAAAEEMSRTLFTLAENSRTSAAAAANIRAAAEAQEIVAKARPNLNSLGTLAIYKVFTFDYAGAEKANEEAKKLATSKSQREQLDTQLEEYRKNAKAFEKQVEEEKDLEKAVQQGEAGGQTEGGFQNPFGVGATP